MVAVPAFPFVSSLCSADSAAVIAALFADFIALTEDSDFLESFVIGLWRLAFPTRTSSTGSGQLQEVSGPEGFHLEPLPEPYVSLSAHTAPIIQPLSGTLTSAQTAQVGVAQCHGPSCVRV